MFQQNITFFSSQRSDLYPFSWRRLELTGTLAGEDDIDMKVSY